MIYSPQSTIFYQNWNEIESPISHSPLYLNLVGFSACVTLALQNGIFSSMKMVVWWLYFLNLLSDLFGQNMLLKQPRDCCDKGLNQKPCFMVEMEGYFMNKLKRLCKAEMGTRPHYKKLIYRCMTCQYGSLRLLFWYKW